MSFDLDKAVTLLANAHRTVTPARVFEPGPESREEAYAVQDAVCRDLGSVGGWKVGPGAAGTPPTCAPILLHLVHPSPATWSHTPVSGYRVEAEIAFKIGQDIPASPEALSAEMVFASIASVHAAIEIVDTRIVDVDDAGPLWKLADNQVNGGFVFDPIGIPWNGQDFTDAAVKLVIDGDVVVEKTGGNPAGNPASLLVWMVNHCTTARGGIPAGTFITTGSYTGITTVQPGAAVTAEFPGVGSTTVHFA